MYKFSPDDGYGDAVYMGFRFVYAAATATLGSEMYSTGAGDVTLKLRKVKIKIFKSFEISQCNYLAHRRRLLLLLLL